MRSSTAIASPWSRWRGPSTASCAPARWSDSTYMAWMATAGSAQPSTRPDGIGYAGRAISGAGIGRRRSDLLEVAAAFPVGDRPVEGVPLLPRRVQEVMVHRRSERLLGDRRRLEERDRIRQ